MNFSSSIHYTHTFTQKTSKRTRSRRYDVQYFGGRINGNGNSHNSNNNINDIKIESNINEYGERGRSCRAGNHLCTGVPAWPAPEDNARAQPFHSFVLLSMFASVRRNEPIDSREAMRIAYRTHEHIRAPYESYTHTNTQFNSHNSV